jgi:hypothetical protein
MKQCKTVGILVAVLVCRTCSHVNYDLSKESISIESSRDSLGVQSGGFNNADHVNVEPARLTITPKKHEDLPRKAGASQTAAELVALQVEEEGRVQSSAHNSLANSIVINGTVWEPSKTRNKWGYYYTHTTYKQSSSMDAATLGIIVGGAFGGCIACALCCWCLQLLVSSHSTEDPGQETEKGRVPHQGDPEVDVEASHPQPPPFRPPSMDDIESKS